MIKVAYPTFDFAFKQQAGKDLVFDVLRKRWVRLTPEEWVRQNFVQFLLQTIQYPAALIAVERVIQLGELRKRFDILVFNKQQQPFLMIECKATTITLTNDVLQQVMNYNVSTPVTFVCITNGNQTYLWQKHADRLEELDNFPNLL